MSAAPPPAPQKKKKGAALAFLFLLGAAALIWFAWKSGDAGSATPAPLTAKEMTRIEKVVNRHLLLTNKEIELQQEKARLENKDEVIPVVGDQILPRFRPHQVNGVDHSPDRNELNAARDLAKPEDLNLSSPNTVIQSEIADRESKSQYAAKYRDAYAKKFIENARNAGYEIELDDNFVVTHVQRLNSSDPNALFDTGSGAAH